MSGLRNKTNNRRGRPKRKSVTALKQQHLKEKTLVSDLLFDLNINEPLDIIQPPKKPTITTATTALSSSSSLSSCLESVDKELPAATERDLPASHQINSDVTLLPLSTSSPCSSVTDANIIVSFDSSELSSEDDTINTTPPPPHPTAPCPSAKPKVNISHGVDLDRLPKVQFIKESTDVNNKFDYDQDDPIYQQEQQAQEEQLLIQHYQMQQQYNHDRNDHNHHNNNSSSSSSGSSGHSNININSTLVSNKDILKYSRVYNRPENHYIHYNEPSDIELYDSVEYDMDEQDQCWLTLYNRERRKDFLGDISPYLFECIMDKLEKEWFNLIKDAPKPETEQVLLPEDSACVVCDDTEVENSNAIVFCDGCNVAVHQDCYGIPYIPEGQWLCRKCMISPEFPVSCIFCPNEGGAFKQTNTNQWGHLLCAIWIPEVGVSNTIYMEPIDQIENIPKSRWKLICSICRRKQGACIQCDNKHCFSAFHVTCAKAAGLCMKINSQSSQSEEGVILKAYCDKHTPKEYYSDKTAGTSRHTIGNNKSIRHRSSNSSSSSSNGSSSSNSSSEEDEVVATRLNSNRGRGARSRARGRGRGRPSKQFLTQQQQQHIDEANNKVARAHQHHYSTGAPIAPDIILAKIDNLPCVRHSGIRKKPQAVTAIAHYWSLKRESRRGAPLLKRLHLEPWTAYSKYTGGENEQMIRKAVITQLRADLEKIRMLSEQVQKRERLKLEQTKKQKAYLEMIFFPLEYVIRPVLSQFMKIDRKKLFLNHVTIDEAADYYTVIKQPMCFSEIYQKLANHSYSTLDHFKNDMQLIWENSMNYNAADTSFYRVASKLKNASEKLFESAQAKMSRFGLLQDDGMLQEPVDESIFTYDASFEQYKQEEQHVLSVAQGKRPRALMDAEAEAQQKLERDRIKAVKEENHQRAIRARVEGRARARALREENKRKGIVPAIDPVKEKAKLATMRKLRTRTTQTEPKYTLSASTSATTSTAVAATTTVPAPALATATAPATATVPTTAPVTAPVNAPVTVHVTVPATVPATTTATTVASATTSGQPKEEKEESSISKEVALPLSGSSLSPENTDMQEIDQMYHLVSNDNIPLETKNQQQAAELAAKQVHDLKIVHSANPPPVQHLELSVNSNVSRDLSMKDLFTKDHKQVVEKDEKKKDEEQSMISDMSGEGTNTISTITSTMPTLPPPSPPATTTATILPAKRRYSPPHVTPRSTRSNGLKASIEELTKRPRISQEARALFSSYNGVSYLDRPVEVYKENRKIHAPIGWVYLEDDDDEEKGEETEDNDEKKSDRMDIDGENMQRNYRRQAAREKPPRQGRNDIPVPEFNRGEIVWARVNGYPSHPAKFLNYSDEEAGPKLVASRRYTGDVLVEFLKVPEMHRFGWVGRRTISEIGDAQIDRQRLEETLQKKHKKKEYIQEAKEGYRCVGTILGLDPEPLLSAVFDHRPQPENKKRKKQPHNKKRK